MDHLVRTKIEYKKKRKKKKGDSRYIYQNKLDKTCFQHDLAYRNFKDLPRRAASDKVLCGEAYNIAKNPKCGSY